MDQPIAQILLTRMDISDVRLSPAQVFAMLTELVADTISECTEYLLRAITDGGGTYRKRERHGVCLGERAAFLAVTI